MTGRAPDEFRLNIVCTGKGSHRRRRLLPLSVRVRPGRPDLLQMVDDGRRPADGARPVETFTGTLIEDLVCPICRRRQQWRVERIREAVGALAERGDTPRSMDWDVSTGLLA